MSNFTKDDYKSFSNQLNIARTIIYSFITIFMVLGNSLVLVVTWRERSLHKPNKYFVACLAVADLLVGIFLSPLKLNEILNSDYVPPVHLCRFIVWMDTIVLTASVCTLTFISYDRYLKINKPLEYRSIMTSSKSLKIIISIWLVSAAFGTYAVTPRSGSFGFLHKNSIVCLDSDINKEKAYYTFLAIIMFFLPTAITLVMYALIFVLIRRRRNLAQSGELGPFSRVQIRRSTFCHDLRVIRIFLVILGAFIMCWGPNFVFLLYDLYHPNSLWHSRSDARAVLIILAVLDVLPYFNSLCNPLIYACLDRKYSKAFQRIFKQVLFRRRLEAQQPTNVTSIRTELRQSGV